MTSSMWRVHVCKSGRFKCKNKSEVLWIVVPLSHPPAEVLWENPSAEWAFWPPRPGPHAPTTHIPLKKNELLVIIVRCPWVYAVFDFFLEMDWVWSDSTSVLCVTAWIMQNRALCCVVLGCCIKTSLMGLERSMGSRPSYLKKKISASFPSSEHCSTDTARVFFLRLRSGMSERISVLSMQNQKNL